MKLRKAIRAKLGHMHFMKELKKVQFKRDVVGFNEAGKIGLLYDACLLYTSDAADERSSVDLGGRRIIKKKNKSEQSGYSIINKTKQETLR